MLPHPKRPIHLPSYPRRHICVPSSTRFFRASTPISQVSPLQGDASDRRYYRLHFTTAVDGITSLVLMRLAQPYTAGELPFVNVQRYLALNQLPVPDILWDDSSHGFILLEDLGDVTLEAALQGASREQTADWYRQALDILLELQYPPSEAPRASCVAFCLAFDVEKLMWELDFFSDPHDQTVVCSAVDAGG